MNHGRAEHGASGGSRFKRCGCKDKAWRHGQTVDFGSIKLMGFLSVVFGVAIAIGVPWVVLNNAGGAGLGEFASTLLSFFGVVGGVTLAIVGAFFSIVIPSRVGKD